MSANSILLAYIDMVHDLGEIFEKAMKELPRKIYVVVPEWKESTFWPYHEAIKGQYVPNSKFQADGEDVGKLSWSAWFGVCTAADLKDARKKKIVSHLGR